jgi:murein L,D-transpeptidase YcbB/YkuD
MNPELEHRLRRFGGTVDAAASAKAAQRTVAGAEATPVAELDNVVPIAARRRRHVRTLVVAAATVAVVAGGIAIAISRSGSPASVADQPATPVPAAVVDSSEPATSAPADDTLSTTTAAPTTTTAAPTTTTAPPSSASASSAPATPQSDRPVCRSYTPTNDYHLDICDSGAAVRLVQERLRAAVDSTLKVDGYFGPGTRAAVRTFQRMHGLAVDGQVGPATWAVLVPDAPGADLDDSGIVDPDEITTG